MGIEELYSKVFGICVQFAVYQKKNVRDNIKKILPNLEVFTKEFLKNNNNVLVEEDYHLLKQLLLDILDDIAQGMENQDEVLLEDALEYGLKELLELLIIDEDKLRQLREESVDEQGNIR